MKTKSIIQFIFISSLTHLSQGLDVSLADSGDPLKRLIVENKRYVNAQLSHKPMAVTLRIELSETQKPFTAILSSSDSRVPPEIIFDQSLGDLFVVRDAGNISSNKVNA